ncbi:hypothetical protein HOV93_13580 [Planctomycetes bacterium FF15]|uniref:Uncharacterized protein n=1 Tax=Bremerella alba TaxID=980252 RepID=A0A7V9A6D6_9BACT|nr:hypothetical protein [Bremerella alba]
MYSTLGFLAKRSCLPPIKGFARENFARYHHGRLLNG